MTIAATVVAISLLMPGVQPPKPIKCQMREELIFYSDGTVTSTVSKMCGKSPARRRLV